MIDSHQDWRGLLASTAPLGYERDRSRKREEKRENGSVMMLGSVTVLTA